MRFHVVLRIIRKCRCFSRYAEMLGQEVGGKTTAPALWAGYLTKTGDYTNGELRPAGRFGSNTKNLTRGLGVESADRSGGPVQVKGLTLGL